MRLSDFLYTDHLPSDEVISLIESDYHENFGFQWKKFSKLQLDSFNGSNESKERLLNQTGLDLSFFKNKFILEIGSGNGRFTEILLNAGAKVIAVDFSDAIYANFENHKSFIESGDLLCIKGDLFDLPLKKKAFDIVFCFGVIQHTGNNEKALSTISEFVKIKGTLLVDIYSNSLKHFNPWIYLIRPFFSRVKNHELKFNIVKKFVDFIFPIQLRIMKLLHKKKGVLKYIRWFFNRSPNSVYGINLFLEDKISLEHAKEWSYCDTFDAWMPKHDHPVSFKTWRKILHQLNNFSVLTIQDCGQGWSANLTRFK